MAANRRIADELGQGTLEQLLVQWQFRSLLGVGVLCLTIWALASPLRERSRYFGDLAGEGRFE